MPHAQTINDAFLKDPALIPLRTRTGQKRLNEGVFYFYLDNSSIVVCDGLTRAGVNPAIFCHFVDVFLDLLEARGRGALFSAITQQGTERKVLLTDNANLTASILDHKLAQALAATVNYPDHVHPG